MDMSSIQEYTVEGFDPTKLKMAQLRSILLQHNVAPPSTARKADLVDLFNQHVAPQAASLRSQNASIVASSSGIIDMRAQRTDDSSSEASPAQPTRRRSAVPRKSIAATPSKSGPEAVTAPPLSPAAQADEGEEVPVKRKRGRPRKSAPAAVPPVDSSPKEVSFEAVAEDRSARPRISNRDGRLPRNNEDESAFSDYNPFQSGSEASPTVGPAAKAAAAARKARRKTTDGRTSRLAARSDEDEEERPSVRPHTKTSVSKSVTMPSFKNYMDTSVAASTPPRIIGKALEKGRDILSPARSLGPEDERADRDQIANDGDAEEDERVEPLAPSPGTQARSRLKEQALKRYVQDDLTNSQKLSQLFWTFVLLAFVAYGIWYARDSKAVGYCDTGSSTNPILDERKARAEAAAALARAASGSGQSDELDEQVVSGIQVIPSIVRPTCARCPSHAECRDGKLLGCLSQDYVLQPSWSDFLPLGSSLLPLSWTTPSCVPDTQKLVLTSELASAINHYVAKWKGDVICGHESPHASVAPLISKRNYAPDLRYALPEMLVRTAMADSRDVNQISEDYFAQLWDLAMEDADAPDSNVIRMRPTNSSSTDNDVAFLAARAPILSIGCRSRISFRAWLKRTRIYFFLVASVVIALTYVRRSWRLAREETKKVGELVQVALERLQEQEYAHAVDPVINPDPFLPTSHLRDHVLRSEHSTSARQRLWKKVAKVVEENSNVRTRQANKRGEWLRVWEWVGVVGSGMSQMGTPQSPRVRSPEKRSASSLQHRRTAASEAEADAEEEIRQLDRSVQSSPRRR